MHGEALTDVPVLLVLHGKGPGRHALMVTRATPAEPVVLDLTVHVGA